MAEDVTADAVFPSFVGQGNSERATYPYNNYSVIHGAA